MTFPGDLKSEVCSADIGSGRAEQGILLAAASQRAKQGLPGSRLEGVPLDAASSIHSTSLIRSLRLSYPPPTLLSFLFYYSFSASQNVN